MDTLYSTMYMVFDIAGKSRPDSHLCFLTMARLNDFFFVLVNNSCYSTIAFFKYC